MFNEILENVKSASFVEKVEEKKEVREERQMSDQEGIDNEREGAAINAQSANQSKFDLGIHIQQMFKNDDFRFIGKLRSASGIHYEFEYMNGQMVKVYVSSPMPEKDY